MSEERRKAEAYDRARAEVKVTGHARAEYVLQRDRAYEERDRRIEDWKAALSREAELETRLEKVREAVEGYEPHRGHDGLAEVVEQIEEIVNPPVKVSLTDDEIARSTRTAMRLARAIPNETASEEERCGTCKSDDPEFDGPEHWSRDTDPAKACRDPFHTASEGSSDSKWYAPNEPVFETTSEGERCETCGGDEAHESWCEDEEQIHTTSEGERCETCGSPDPPYVRLETGHRVAYTPRSQGGGLYFCPDPFHTSSEGEEE